MFGGQTTQPFSPHKIQNYSTSLLAVSGMLCFLLFNFHRTCQPLAFKNSNDSTWRHKQSKWKAQRHCILTNLRMVLGEVIHGWNMIHPGFLQCEAEIDKEIQEAIAAAEVGWIDELMGAFTASFPEILNIHVKDTDAVLAIAPRKPNWAGSWVPTNLVVPYIFILLGVIDSRSRMRKMGAIR